MRYDLKLIAACDMHGGIGRDGELLVRISEDMKRFKSLTKGETVVYGRKTLDTFPGKKPLPKRNNIVLSRNRELFLEGATVVHSVDKLMELLDSMDGVIWVIGGAQIYEQLLPYCNEAYITRLYGDFDADAFIEDFSSLEEWRLIEASEIFEDIIQYRFELYSRNG